MSAQVQTSVERANERAIETIGKARIRWVDVVPASQALPVLGPRTLLHAGPPVEPERMCGAMRNAVCGAAVYEGWAEDLQDAVRLMERGHIRFGSAHDQQALGPMAGIISASMPVVELEDAVSGRRSFATLNEGLGRTLRFGANDQEVIGRLRWIERTLAPMLKAALALAGPIDISEIMARAVQRGDECHNRNKSATSLLFRKIAPWMVRTDYAKEDIAQALLFIDGNDHFFLNFSMAASKAIMDQVHELAGSSLVSCMAANGVEFGIKVCGCGPKWYTAPAPRSEGQYFEGYGPEDANPVIGDSYISETCGLGGVAMAAAPGIVRFVGGTVEEGVAGTLEMYKITIAEHPLYKIPALGFRGTPLGIDVRAVLAKGILPIINSGIAHREPGVGQIGAGRFRPPIECFEAAARDLGLA